MDEEFVTQRAIDQLLPERLTRLRRVTGLPMAIGGAIRQGPGGQQLILDRMIGTAGDSLRGLVVRPGKGLGGRVLSGRIPVRVNDYSSTLSITHDYDQAVQEEGLTSVFAVPVLIHGQVRGVLYGAVRDRRPIGDRPVRAAVVMAEQLQCDVEKQLLGERGEPSEALAQLAALIRDTTDPELRARLVRIQRTLTGQSPATEPKSTLSPREIDTLRLVEVGASNLEIAARLGLRLETVKAYLRSAMRKLEVHNRTAAAHQARVTGML